MGRPRVQSAAPSAQSLGAGRSPASTEKLGDVSRLLRARSFWVEGDSKAAQRVRANLQLGTVPLDKEAVAWISDGRVPEDKLGISLDDGAALLGPHSFGFLNNTDGIAPLAAPLGERPRVGRVALVVPRRDALPELAPLLCSRLLGVSWLISVGDGDPSEVLRFLQHDPATAGMLIALGKGVRPQTLLDALGPRVPSAAQSQKQFTAALVLLARAGDAVPGGSLDRLELLRLQAQARFAAITLGRGQLRVGALPESFQGQRGAPVGVSSNLGAATGLDLSQAMSWIAGKQLPSGLWQDKPATALRDTRRAVAVLGTSPTTHAAALTAALVALRWAGICRCSKGRLEKGCGE